MLAIAREGMWQSAVAGHVGLTHATVNRKFQRHAAIGNLVPGKSTGSPDNHASSRACFVEDGLTGSLHKYSSFGGADEKFIWNEDCLKNIDNRSCPMVTVPIDTQGSPC